MSRYRFELASPGEADDADLRRILAATPSEGRIAVSFLREPSWFAGSVVHGRFRQVVACRDLQTGRIVGFGCRSVRDVYVNGVPQPVGYLSNLRLLPEHRNLGLVARGFAFFRELHADRRAKLYLTTIAEGNATALGILTSGRARLPKYHPAGAYHTVAIPLPRHRPSVRPKGGLTVRPAGPDDLAALRAFLAGTGSRRQFFPCLEDDDFRSPDGLMRGLALDQVFLAERGGELVGTLAGWDQHEYKQNAVHAYHGWLRPARPFYNAWSRLRGLPGLPAPGAPLPYLMGALPVAAGDDPSVFAALLKTLIARAAGGPWSHLLLGLHDGDPLLHVARRVQAASYVTRLFLVSWPDGDEQRAGLDGRAAYLEAGSL